MREDGRMSTIIVGAGITGLSCAQTLNEHGERVTVLDKGRGVGGRLATRRIGAATFDHGAQFFTVRDQGFQHATEEYIRRGLVYEWCRGFTADPDGFARYAVTGGMAQLAKYLAQDISVRTNTLVFGVAPSTSGWIVTDDAGTTYTGDKLVVTCPLPQAFSLLFTAGVQIPEKLARTEYDRTIALLAVVNDPPDVGSHGARPDSSGGTIFSMIVDNQRKGVSAVPAITAHANAPWSKDHWDTPHEVTHQKLLNELRGTLTDVTVVESQVKRWRFATPQSIWPDPCWVWPGSGPRLVLAGDAFAGPRVEGAWLSGRAAASAVLRT